MNNRTSAAMLEDLRFLRYRLAVIAEMPNGPERAERLHAVETRMRRIERDLRVA